MTRHFSAPIPDDSLPNILPNSQFSACVIVCLHQNIEDPKRNGFASGGIQTRGLLVDNRGCCHLSHRNSSFKEIGTPTVPSYVQLACQKLRQNVGTAAAKEGTPFLAFHPHYP